MQTVWNTLKRYKTSAADFFGRREKCLYCPENKSTNRQKNVGENTREGDSFVASFKQGGQVFSITIMQEK